MSPDTMTLVLGDRRFEVPRLPLGLTIVVYPICQRLTNAGLVERILENPPAGVALSESEFADLTELAFQAAHVVDESIDTKAFLKLPVTPGELFAAFFIMRFQCGAWRKLEAKEGEDRDGQGEGPGAMPPISTSTASSPVSSATSISRSSTGSPAAPTRTGSRSTGASSAKRRRPTRS